MNIKDLGDWNFACGLRGRWGLQEHECLTSVCLKLHFEIIIKVAWLSNLGQHCKAMNPDDYLVHKHWFQLLPLKELCSSCSSCCHQVELEQPPPKLELHKVVSFAEFKVTIFFFNKRLNFNEQHESIKDCNGIFAFGNPLDGQRNGCA